MSNERKILYVSAGINFVIGIIAGIILFCGQMRNDTSVTGNIYEFDTVVSATDFFRMTWINLIWMFSIVAARNMLRAKLIHPVLLIRGCVNSFSLLYILGCFGMKEALSAILPQCFSVLPMIMVFSAELAVKHSDRDGGDYIRKSTFVAILLLSAVSSGVEVLLFRVFCAYLF